MQKCYKAPPHQSWGILVSTHHVPVSLHHQRTREEVSCTGWPWPKQESGKAGKGWRWGGREIFQLIWQSEAAQSCVIEISGAALSRPIGTAAMLTEGGGKFSLAHSSTAAAQSCTGYNTTMSAYLFQHKIALSWMTHLLWARKMVYKYCIHYCY